MNTISKTIVVSLLLAGMAHADLIIHAEAGYMINWISTGEYQDAAVPANLARSATAISSSDYPAVAHTAAGINDGIYGNSNSWLANDSDASPSIRLSWESAVEVSSIAFGRDNTSTGFTDRSGANVASSWTISSLTHTLEYTQDGENWQTIGSVTYNGNENTAYGDTWLRHKYGISTDDGSAVAMTGFRLSPSSNMGAIDELEIHAIPEPATLTLISIAGLLGLIVRRCCS